MYDIKTIHTYIQMQLDTGKTSALFYILAYQTVPVFSSPSFLYLIYWFPLVLYMWCCWFNHLGEAGSNNNRRLRTKLNHSLQNLTTYWQTSNIDVSLGRSQGMQWKGNSWGVEGYKPKVHIHQSFQSHRGPKHPVHSGSESYAGLLFTADTFQTKTLFCIISVFTTQSEWSSDSMINILACLSII